ncbi:spore germination protein [Aminipila butyrica]|uniref:Spore germination protein n=1 Tax=Aminipila butyrica TaxID=433296 RepID=A0A858BUC6_9FIRM|nr:spore germination protein [Aminipila butyrica]QIB69641.1 spore germination protein [Aminipila butyrica]
MQNNNYWAETLKSALPIGESFDIIVRDLQIGGKKAVMFFVNGLVTGDTMPMVMSYLLKIKPEEMKDPTDASLFLKENLPFLDAQTDSQVESILKFIFSGLIALAVEGFSEVIIIDSRHYPNRGIEEPSKEKSLRGAKDGFTEAFMTNIALIRRRIRDPKLIFTSHTVGTATRTDVSLVYMKGKADEALVKKIADKLNSITIDAVSVGDQTITEHIIQEIGQKSFLGWLNPYPKVRYTQRPDVAAAHLTEGKIAIVVDTSPTVILLPTGIFDFLQDVDDYYFPAITGNYFRLLRAFNFIGIIFITPLYLMFAQAYVPVYDALKFFIPQGDFAISLFWQFILLELAIDGLKLASLNTPDSLGMSLSVIGALILGELAITSGWFIPQTILCMAVVALASFTQPSIELGYGIKFMRIFILIGVQLGAHLGATSFAAGLLGDSSISICAIGGAVVATIIDFISVATTKTLAGTSYLYPLMPFDGNAVKHLFFRTKA